MHDVNEWVFRRHLVKYGSGSVRGIVIDEKNVRIEPQPEDPGG
jgi:hypothetical protein